MNSTAKTLSWLTLCFTVPGTAIAQQQAQTPATQPTAQSEAGEPRADTSSPVPQAPAESASRPAPEAPAGTASGPRAASRSAAAAPARGGGSDRKSSSQVDRLDLGLATVTGDHEQPKVMYIVPWKKSDIGDLTARPMNSLVDEILAPVDRDVFKREVVYYNALQADASQNGASPKPAQQGEK